jgi:ABC-2 type transport system permease protein
MSYFSWARTWAVLVKEFQHVLRDRLTFAMAVGIPILQLILFGYAINTDPKNLPSVAVVADNGQMSQSVLKALENTGYFKFVQVTTDEHLAEQMITTGQVQYMVVVPANFTRDVIRGDHPSVLLSVDGTDPAASGNAIAAVNVALPQMLSHDLVGPLASLSTKSVDQTPFTIVLHRRYNPEGLSRYNIVPGLVGTILTMTLVVLTSLAMTRERERGTMENLLATPVKPMEVMVGKILPYVLVGYIQLLVILSAAFLIFDVPMQGSFLLLLFMIGVFMIANLGVGFTFSTIAKNQLQAMQMAFFFFLPSILLSGFMFPYRAMPQWAQYLGEILPLTHFLRIVRGVMLKGNTLMEVLPQLWPMLIFLLAAVTLAMKRYQKTLD